MSYLLRVTEANGYSTLSYVLASMHGYWYRSAVGRLDAAPLAELAGLTKKEVARLTHRPERRPFAYVRVYGNDLPSYEVTLRHPKVCPQCLAETGHCEAFWDLAQAVACPVHRVMLVTECTYCESNLSWARQKLKECKCGADLTRLPMRPADTALCKLMAIMRHLVYRDLCPAPCPESMQHLANLDLQRLCKLLWVLSTCLHQRHGARDMPKARSRYLGQLGRIAVAMEDWPTSFQILLTEMYEKELGTISQLPNFMKSFGWLMVRLIKNDKQGGEAYAFLEREAYRFGARFWTRGAMNRKGGSEHLLPDTFRWGTIGEAAQILGLHMTTMKRLIEAGEIKTRTVSIKKTRSVVVDLDWARSQKISRHPSISIREAAKMVGVSIETLKAMRKNGLYEGKYRPRHRDSLTKEDIDVLSARLRGMQAGRCAARGKHIIALDDAFARWGASPAEKAALFAELLENPALIVGCRVKRAGGGGVQVSIATLATFFMNIRREPCVTAQMAAKRLKCTAAVITALKRSGRLQCKPHRGRLLPCEKSLRQFEESYEAMSVIARRVGVSATRAYARVNLSKIKHFKLATSAYTTVFIHRNQMTTMEKRLIALKD